MRAQTSHRYFTVASQPVQAHFDRESTEPFFVRLCPVAARLLVCTTVVLELLGRLVPDRNFWLVSSFCFFFLLFLLSCFTPTHTHARTPPCHKIGSVDCCASVSAHSLTVSNCGLFGSVSICVLRLCVLLVYCCFCCFYRTDYTIRTAQCTRLLGSSISIECAYALSLWSCDSKKKNPQRLSHTPVSIA